MALTIRTFATGLISLLILSLMSVLPARAADGIQTWDELVAAFATGGDVVLGADIDGEGSLRLVDADVTLDLAGHRLTVTGAPAIEIPEGTTLRIDDSAGGGQLIAEGSSRTVSTIGALLHMGHLVIDGGDIAIGHHTSWDPSSYEEVHAPAIGPWAERDFYGRYRGALTINGGSVDVERTWGRAAVIGGPEGGNGITVEVYGGELDARYVDDGAKATYPQASDRAYGAVIGGGEGNTWGSIFNLYGGIVRAEGFTTGAVIGSGDSPLNNPVQAYRAGDVAVHGGELHINVLYDWSAGIGLTESLLHARRGGGSFTMTDGLVKIVGVHNGAAIGGSPANVGIDSFITGGELIVEAEYQKAEVFGAGWDSTWDREGFYRGTVNIAGEPYSGEDVVFPGAFASEYRAIPGSTGTFVFDVQPRDNPLLGYTAHLYFVEKVTYDSDGGSPNPGTAWPQRGTTHDGLGTAPSHDSAGDFVGWFHGDVLIEPGSPVTQSLDLVARYGEQNSTVIVTADPANGQEPTRYEVRRGGSLAGLPVPSKPNAEFLGWLVGDMLVDDSFTVTADLTVRAAWGPGEHLVRFVTYGGSAVDPVHVRDGQPIDRLPEPTREGHTFLGWNDGPYPWSPDQSVTRLTTLHAQWQIHTFTVTFDFGYSKSPQVVKRNWGTKSTVPTTNRPGYEFLYWENKATGEVWTNDQLITEDIELLAHWKALPYTVTFDPNGGELTSPATVEVVHGDRVAEPTAPVWEGHVFTGWFRDDLKWNFSSRSITADTTLVARWDDQVHTVTFKPGYGWSAITEQVTYGGKASVPETRATLTGHTLTGWLLDGEPFDFDTPITKDLELTAEWTPNDYTVTVDFADGSEAQTFEIPYYTRFSLDELPTREGYILAGWQVGSGVTSLPYLITTDVTLTAVWEPITYTATFDTAGGSPIAPIEVGFGDRLTAPLDPTREGHDFVGWYHEGLPYTFGSVLTEDITLVATWDIREHLVTFVHNDDKGTVTTLSVEHGLPIAPPAVTWGDHEFEGWIGPDGPWDFSQPVTHDLTLTADWFIPSISIGASTVRAGETVTVEGDDLEPGAQYALTLESEELSGGGMAVGGGSRTLVTITVTADVNGRFSVPLTIPSNAAGPASLSLLADDTPIARAAFVILAATAASPGSGIAATGVELAPWVAAAGVLIVTGIVVRRRIWAS